jgi:hypothetical protein
MTIARYETHHHPVLGIHPVEETHEIGGEALGIVEARHHLGRERRPEAHMHLADRFRPQGEIPEMVRRQHIHMAGEDRGHHGGVALRSLQPGIGGMGAAIGGAFRLGEGLQGEARGGLRGEDRVLGREPGPHRLAMGDREVIALHEILGQQLPIRIPDMIVLGNGQITRHVIGRDHRLQRGQEPRQALGGGIEGDIDPALPDLAADLRQMMLARIEAGGALHMGGGQELAVGVIGPGVIGADDPAAASPPLDEAHHPMQADIGEGADAALAPNDEEGLVVDGEAEVVARLRDLCGEARAEPAAGKEFVPLAREDFRVVVEAGRHGGRRGQGAVRQPHKLGEKSFGPGHAAPVKASA